MHVSLILAVATDLSLIQERMAERQTAEYFVTSAGTIKEAIDFFHSADFDLVLLGSSIPDESRQRLTYLIRASGSRSVVASIRDQPESSDSYTDATFENTPDGVLRGIRKLLADREGSFIAANDSLLSGSEFVYGQPLHNAQGDLLRTEQQSPRGARFQTRHLEALETEWELLSDDLSQALEQEQFSLLYQPVVDLVTGGIIAVEALPHWRHPTRGAIYPAQYIQIAEHSHQMPAIGDWVIRQACLQMKTWTDAGIQPRRIAVNITVAELKCDDFADRLLEALSSAYLQPTFLELDIPAHVLIEASDRAELMIRKLKALGVYLSLDNYGRHEHCEMALSKLPFDAFKIDRSLIRRITKTTSDRARLSGIIDMGKSLQMHVLAKGVESARQLEFLWERSCDEAQGYYFGHPVPAEKISWLRSVQ